MGILPTKNAFLSVSHQTKKRFAVGILSDKKGVRASASLETKKQHPTKPRGQCQNSMSTHPSEPIGFDKKVGD